MQNISVNLEQILSSSQAPVLTKPTGFNQTISNLIENLKMRTKLLNRSIAFPIRFGSKTAVQDGARGKLRTNPYQLPVSLHLMQVRGRRTGHPISYLSITTHQTSHPLPVSPMCPQIITFGVSIRTAVPPITSRQKFPPQIQFPVLCSLVLHSASFTRHVRLSPRQRRHPSQRWRSVPVLTREITNPPLCTTTRTAWKAVTLRTSISLP